jgi:hypothetical protein
LALATTMVWSYQVIPRGYSSWAWSPGTGWQFRISLEHPQRPARKIPAAQQKRLFPARFNPGLAIKFKILLILPPDF